jgi:3alpha(or 20beta)-hydroxysteroid dehydrogenase
MKRLQNKVAVVTGGGSGIGAATAALFAREGARVLVVGRTEDKLRQTVQPLPPEHVSYCVADVSSLEETQHYVREAVQRYGGLDILVANAGYEGGFVPITDYPVEEFDRVMATNVRGTFLAAKYAFPELKKRGGGSIVITSSIAGFTALPAHAAYVASKHALLGMARSLALDGAPLHIRVNAVCPGSIDNDMMAAAHRMLAPGKEAEFRGAIEARIPLKRYGTNEEIARLNLFLASDEGSYLTGGAYTADGGLTAGIS